MVLLERDLHVAVSHLFDGWVDFSQNVERDVQLSGVTSIDLIGQELLEVCLLMDANSNNRSICGTDDQSGITNSITPYTLIRPNRTSRSSRGQLIQCLKLRVTHRYRLGKIVPTLGKYIATVLFS